MVLHSDTHTCPGRLGPLACTQDAGHDYGCTYESGAVPQAHSSEPEGH